MIFQNEKQILKIIRYTPIIFVLIISILILAIQFIEKNDTFKIEKNKIQNEYLQKDKLLIKQRVNEVYNYIQREKNKTENELKESLNIAISNAHTIATTIYEQNKDKDDKFIKKLIIDALRNIRFNKGRGYYFIYEKSGKNLLLPYHEELEGKNFLSHKDSKGKYIVKDMIDGLKTKDSFFIQWYWFNPLNKTEQKRKVGLVKNFAPYNWFIGTGEYIENYEKEVQTKILDHVRDIRYGKNGYIFIISYDGIYLSHIRESYWGRDALTNNDTKDIARVIRDLIYIAKNGEGYYKYIQHKKPENDKATSKTSFVKGFNDWSWMIGTGFYEDDMNKAIENKKNDLNEHFKNNLYKTIYFAIGLILILLTISIYFSKLLERKFKKYRNEINLHLAEKAQQQAIMSQQSKMAAMGEMIGNIAHQWRQPLSVISTTSTGLKLQKEMKVLNDDFLLQGLDSINEQTQYLSNTIDDFRNFFNVNKQKKSFKIKRSINKVCSLIEMQFTNKGVHIIQEIEDIEIINLESELIQVIINILNNARDELIKLEQRKEKLIFISVTKEKESVIIKIKDNAGGIKEDILDRVFEPYFTTKYQSQGTGIGLYMSREIINKNMNGSIIASNTTFKYKDEEYKGALFQLTLPIN